MEQNPVSGTWHRGKICEPMPRRKGGWKANQPTTHNINQAALRLAHSGWLHNVRVHPAGAALPGPPRERGQRFSLPPRCLDAAALQRLRQETQPPGTPVAAGRPTAVSDPGLLGQFGPFRRFSRFRRYCDFTRPVQRIRPMTAAASSSSSSKERRGPLSSAIRSVSSKDSCCSCSIRAASARSCAGLSTCTSTPAL